MFCLKTIIDQLTLKEEKLIVFIRHAEKSLPMLDQLDFDLSITEKGIVQSHAIGVYLKKQFKKIGKIKTSPVKRCMQTAEILVRALDYPIEALGTSNLLGHPGPYVMDDKKALLTFERYSVYEVIEQQLKEKSLPGMRNIHEGTKLLWEELIKDTNHYDSPILYISHDVILAAFIMSLVPYIQLNQLQWISYLQGFCISQIKNKWFVHMAHNCYQINRKDNSYAYFN